MFSKGASEMLLGRCSSHIAEDGSIQQFGPEDLRRIDKEVIQPMASNGLRTICLAYKDFLANGVPPEKGM